MNFMQLAYDVAKQSTCLKRQVGCVVVKNNKVISIGFNHGYNEICHCDMNNKNPDVLHAEEMALASIDTADSIYITYKPCDKCLKLIQDKNIKNVYYEDVCSKHRSRV